MNLISLTGDWINTLNMIGFMSVNLLIVYSDLKKKKIPNKYLLYLLIFFIVNIILNFKYKTSINLDWGLGLFISFCVGFGIYLFHGWAPGDAKYFIVLSLFLTSSNDIIRFIGNISTVSVAGILLVATGKLLKKFMKRKGFGKIEWGTGNLKKWNDTPTKDSMLDFIYILLPLLGYFFATIFLREYLYGKIETFQTLGINFAVVLFLGLLLMRSLQKWLKSNRHNTLKQRIWVIFLSILPIVYGVMYKWDGLWYYMRDILLYGLPTMLFASLCLTYGVRLVRKQDRHRVLFRELPPSEIPLYVLLEGKAVRTNSRDDVEKYCEENGQIIKDVQVVISTTSPFGHYIFLSFLITAASSIHLAYFVMRLWFNGLTVFWEFFRQWI